MPKLHNYLFNKTRGFNEIEVISARDSYQSMSKDCFDLKHFAFSQLISRFLNSFGQQDKKENQFLNIISIGDAQFERYALFRSVYGIKNCLGKSLKFIDKPSINILNNEIMVLLQQIGNICGSFTNYDLNMYVK